MKTTKAVWIAVAATAVIICTVLLVSADGTKPPAGSGIGDAGGWIKTFEVTITTANGPDSGTDADIWLVASVKVGQGQTDGSTTYLGAGAPKGSQKKFTADSRRGDLNQDRIGSLTLVNAMNGPSPDWEIETVRVVGIDTQGKRWLIADWTIPPGQAWRRWLRSDPRYPSQGPAMNIPTLNQWSHL